VLYPPSAAPGWRFNLALALAVFADRRQALVAGLERERQELVAFRPVVPAAVLPEQAPAHIAVTHAVASLYIGRPGQGTGRRILQGTVAGVVTLLVLSIAAGLSSTATTSPPVVGLPTASSSPSRSVTRAPEDTTPPPAPAVVAATPAAPRPLPKVPTQHSRVTAAPKRSPKPTPKPTPRPTTRVTPKPTPKPTLAAAKLCGAPGNPWGYTFCGGSHITSPPSDFCGYFDCITNFPNGKGYVEQCSDGMFSLSGGRRGACSYHGGERRPLFK
jgi:hypothetical protein